MVVVDRTQHGGSSSSSAPRPPHALAAVEDDSLLLVTSLVETALASIEDIACNRADSMSMSHDPFGPATGTPQSHRE